MDIQLEKLSGRYVLAISGGVDSVSLLDLMVKLNLDTKENIIVAHFDHGIRNDSKKDRILVQDLAKKYGLTFYFEEANLGQKTSEALARKKRYQFLDQIKKRTNSAGIITAHHQDDLIETAILNILRGTNRRGLSPLKNNEEIKRPFLDYDKKTIIEYALKNNLRWIEDSTNKDTKYLRNYLRINVLPKLSQKDRLKMIELIKKNRIINNEIDKIIFSIYQKNFKNNQFSRLWFDSLDYDIQKEFIVFLLLDNKIKDYSSQTIKRLVNSLKTFPNNVIIEISNQNFFKINKDIVTLVNNKK